VYGRGFKGDSTSRKPPSAGLDRCLLVMVSQNQPEKQAEGRQNNEPHKESLRAFDLPDVPDCVSWAEMPGKQPYRSRLFKIQFWFPVDVPRISEK
jgi:hypothetical protein